MDHTEFDDNKLYQLWQSKRSGDRLPARKDFDVLELGPWMGDIGLVDIIRGDTVRFRFRLIGTNFSWLQGCDITGRFADEVFDDASAYVVEEYEEVVRTGQPLFRQRPIRTKKLGAKLLYRKVIMPLAADGTTVDMLMVHLYPAGRLDESL